MAKWHQIWQMYEENPFQPAPSLKIHFNLKPPEPLPEHIEYLARRRYTCALPPNYQRPSTETPTTTPTPHTTMPTTPLQPIADDTTPHTFQQQNSVSNISSHKSSTASADTSANQETAEIAHTSNEASPPVPTSASTWADAPLWSLAAYTTQPTTQNNNASMPKASTPQNATPMPKLQRLRVPQHTTQQQTLQLNPVHSSGPAENARNNLSVK